MNEWLFSNSTNSLCSRLGSSSHPSLSYSQASIVPGTMNHCGKWVSGNPSHTALLASVSVIQLSIENLITNSKSRQTKTTKEITRKGSFLFPQCGWTLGCTYRPALAKAKEHQRCKPTLQFYSVFLVLHTRKGASRTQTWLQTSVCLTELRIPPLGFFKPRCWRPLSGKKTVLSDPLVGDLQFNWFLNLNWVTFIQLLFITLFKIHKRKTRHKLLWALL